MSRKPVIKWLIEDATDEVFASWYLNGRRTSVGTEEDWRRVQERWEKWEAQLPKVPQ